MEKYAAWNLLQLDTPYTDTKNTILISCSDGNQEYMAKNVIGKRTNYTNHIYMFKAFYIYQLCFKHACVNGSYTWLHFLIRTERSALRFGFGSKIWL